MNDYIIGLDFDGTCVKHCFPEIGEDVPYVVPVLKWVVSRGAKLLLHTMRSDVPEKRPVLSEAVNWFKEREIELWAVQKNPTQHLWTLAPKAYCHLYIDDAALGIPLIYPDDGGRPYVDFLQVHRLLQNHDFFQEPIH